jgi:hypothetical protein
VEKRELRILRSRTTVRLPTSFVLSLCLICYRSYGVTENTPPLETRNLAYEVRASPPFLKFPG